MGANLRVVMAVLRVTWVALAFAIVSSGHILADEVPPEGDAQGTELDGAGQLPPKPKHPRLDTQLNRLVEKVEEAGPVPSGAEAPPEQDTLVPVTIRGSYSVSTTVALLELGGARVANIGYQYIEAMVPVTMLVGLASHEGVTRVETIVPPQPAVTSQGTLLHRSNIWNARGYTGAGVKVGIIDSGFEGFGALTGTELPSSVVARCYTGLGVFTSSLIDCETDGDHGTAVAEAVKDMAPEVSLYIANPFSKGDLQSSASWMVSQGVTVINMSLAWTWDGPGDGTSPNADSPLVTVDIAVNGGAIWVNSAGNAAKSSWYGSYSDLDGDGWLEFSGTVETNEVG